MASRGWSFQPLLWFWGLVVGGACGAAVALQAFGPPPVIPPSVGPAVHPLPAKPPVPPLRAPEPRLEPPPALAMTGTPIPDPSADMLEPAPDLPGQFLPRTAPDGRRPATAYAAAFDPDERHPRVALVVDGMGLDLELSQKALATLPAAVDVAWSAYAPPDHMAGLAGAARAQGRECLLSIPMEPTGFPNIDEGSHALLTGADPAVNRANLHWALAGVQGCVGATGASDGMLGERFATTEQAFADVRGEVEQRGLLYLDPAEADIVIDRGSNPAEPVTADEIDAHLAELTQRAAAHGSAVGLAGPPRAVMLERIAIWAQGLAAHGIVLAPYSALPRQLPSSAAPGAAPTP